MDRKKQRGAYRKLKTMFQHIDNFVPFTKTDQIYEHFHVPSSLFIESYRTSEKIKIEFCKKWIETAERFITQKPKELTFCKVVAVLSVPNYWSSQIIIFYDESYYHTFWKRTGNGQIWKLEPEKKSFCKRYHIVTAMKETCYHETIIEDNQEFQCDLCFYGDILNVS